MLITLILLIIFLMMIYKMLKGSRKTETVENRVLKVVDMLINDIKLGVMGGEK